MRLPCFLVVSMLIGACSSDGGGDSDTDTEGTSDATEPSSSSTSSSGSASATTDPSTSSPTTGATETSDGSEDTGGETTDEDPLSPGCGMPLANDWYMPYTASWGGETQRVTVDVGGVEREFLIEFPEPYDETVGYPLMLAFHGLGGNMDNNFGQQLGMAWGFEAIVVYPQGLDDGGGATWVLDPAGRDVDLFDAVLDVVGDQMCVDRTRVFAWGFSQGGFFSNVLSCARGDRIAGAAPASAGMSLSSLDCVAPVAQFVVHGDADTVVPLGQGQSARDVWRNVNGCSEDTVPDAHENCVRYDTCESGDPVVWCEMPGAGHSVHQDLPGIEDAAVAFLRAL